MVWRIFVDIKNLSVLVQECKQKIQAQESPEMAYIQSQEWCSKDSGFSLFGSLANYIVSRMSKYAVCMLFDNQQK